MQLVLVFVKNVVVLLIRVLTILPVVTLLLDLTVHRHANHVPIVYVHLYLDVVLAMLNVELVLVFNVQELVPVVPLV